MKKLINLLIIFISVILISSCSAKTDEIEFPFALNNIEINYDDNIELKDLETNEINNNIDELASSIDIHVIKNNDLDMHYFKLSNELKEEALLSPISFVSKVLQICPISHNSYLDYDDSKLDENLIGIKANLEAYASKKIESKTIKVYDYQFIKNLNNDYKKLSIAELPLYKNNNGYLKVINSEELFYAALNNYFPYIENKDSEVYKIFSNSIDILSRITNDNMTKLEIFKAIYQYVENSSFYSNETLNDSSLQVKENRAFFLEGAVLDNIAVCDGLTKELVFLSRLMGIESYHIGARNNNQGHAYSYVKIDNNYYLSCPTYGLKGFNLNNNYYEYMTNNYFLTDLDGNDSTFPYNSNAYEAIEEKITASYNYWSNNNLNPSNKEEAISLLKDCYDLYKSFNKPISIELMGSYDILREAYLEMKKEYSSLRFEASGTFESKRVQAYIFGV